MKIERLSENQIRCTLNKADLTEKQLKISELAYGTQKAKELFKDMMQQASVELGFEVDDTPLMIEAIPISPDCLVLIVTKVEDPEELDTRFSRFSKTSEYDIDEDDDNTISGLTSTAGDFAAANKNEASVSTQENDPQPLNNMSALYIFDSLPTIISASKQVASFYFSENNLYKNPANGRYYLVLTNSHNTPQEFVRVCNILAEYGSSYKMTYAMPAHFKEHFTCIMSEDALQTLSAL